MPAFVDPITDKNNPLYCPAVPATTYLNNLRLRQLLPQSTNSGSPNLSLAFDFRLKQLLSRQSHGAEEPPAWQILDISPNASAPPNHGPNRKNCFRDVGTPPTRAWPKPQFHGAKASPSNITDAYQDGFPVLTPETERLLDRLDHELPGIRLKGRLWELGVIDPQSIMDFLCSNGNSHNLSPPFTDAIQPTSTRGLCVSSGKPA